MSDQPSANAGALYGPGRERYIMNDEEREELAAERADIGLGTEGVAEAILSGIETEGATVLEGIENFNDTWAERTGQDATVPSPTDRGLDAIIMASNRAAGKVLDANPRTLSREEQRRLAFLEEGTVEPEAEQSSERGTEQSSVDDIMASLNRTPAEEAELVERLGLNEPDEPEDYWYDEDEAA